jgi:integrase
MTTFPEYVEDYLRLRRALGYKLVEPGRTLPRFAAHLEATGTEFVTVDAALAWALEPDVPQGSVVRPMRMLVARGFARYMAGIDPRTEIPRTGLLPFGQRWRAPFIYSDADIMALMKHAHRVIPEPLRAATFETLIGLFASTGLRISEAIKLDCSDIDWSEGVLLVRESKVHEVPPCAAAREHPPGTPALRTPTRCALSKRTCRKLLRFPARDAAVALVGREGLPRTL